MAANSHSLDLESGSSQRASIADASQTGLDLSGDHSVAFWTNFESTPASGDQMMWLSKWNAGTGDRSYQYGMFNDGGTLKVQATLSPDGANGETVRWAWTPSTSTQYHIAVTCDISQAVASQWELFINGASQGNGSVISDQTAGAIYNGAADFSIGSLNNGSAAYFDGLIDEVVITSDIMTQQEVSDLYSGWDATEKLDNIVSYWKLNNDYLDETANNNDLTATGSPSFSTTVPFANYATASSGNFFLVL